MKIHKDDFFQYYIYDEMLKKQGWKIHIFSTAENSKKILNICKSIAENNKINFKYVHNLSELEHFTCKETDYKFAGKFITFYVGESSATLVNIIELLYERLQVYPPYKIIGDKNYKNSIINYRYGNYDSNRDYIISKDGLKIKDKRNIYLPKELKFFDPLLSDVKFEEKETDEIILNKKYKIIKILSFSNLGGIYLSLNLETNEECVLKEYRFYQYDKNSSRANEIRFSFDKPRYIEKFNINNSLFCVFEFLEGYKLSEIDFKKNDTVIIIIEKLRRLINKYHDKNIIMNDIKIDNFILSDNEVYFVDREHCYFLDEKQIYIQRNVISKNGLSCFIDQKINDRLKFVEVILNLLKIRIEVFFVKNDIKHFFQYLNDLFILLKLPKNIFDFIKQIVIDENTSKLKIYDKRINILKRKTFYEEHLNSIIELTNTTKTSDFDLSKEFNNNDLYSFIFEKIINKKINFNFISNCSKLNLDNKNFEDTVKMVLLWKYNNLVLDIEKHIIEIINNFVVEQEGNYYIKENRFLIPYIKNGIGILSLIIIEVIEQNEKFRSSKLFDYLNKFYMGISKFPITSTKTSLLFGSAGISFLLYYIGKFLKKDNYLKVSQSKLFNIAYMHKNLKWQTQDNVELDNSFFNGNKGIIWVLNYVQNKN